MENMHSRGKEKHCQDYCSKSSYTLLSMNEHLHTALKQFPLENSAHMEDLKDLL